MTPELAQEFAKWVAVIGMAGVLFGGWQFLLWLREQQYVEPEERVMSKEEFELAKTERALADMADADVLDEGDEGEQDENDDVGYRDADLFSRV